MLRLNPFYTFLGTGICMLGSLGFMFKSALGRVDSVKTEIVTSGTLKAVVTLFTLPVLQLLEPQYVTSPFFIFRFIYYFATCTLIFAPLLILINNRPVSLKRIGFEIFSSALGLMGWVIICGFSAAICRSTIAETGHRFFWIALCSFVNGGLFMANGLLFAVYFVNKRLPSRRNSCVKRSTEEQTEAVEDSLEEELEKLISRQEAALWEQKQLLLRFRSMKHC
ncbi:hypothetical protein L596_024587 [Steinernema carpocapsae]|uniref:MARVEL domain-containing protein n=1 Tax=Steinernema carpocapsae TaxID=34508 RepID=A0A4U5MH73_STECR|nr:hypothetical protein L596_024587 [Steinernema carpocapsae]